MKKIINAAVFIATYLIIAGPAMAACYYNSREIPCQSGGRHHEWIFMLCLLVLGLIFAIKPEWHVKFLIWSQDFFLGAKFIPSKKTEMVIRWVGVAFVVLALLLLLL